MNSEVKRLAAFVDGTISVPRGLRPDIYGLAR
jgi:hypothetical protein